MTSSQNQIPRDVVVFGSRSNVEWRYYCIRTIATVVDVGARSHERADAADVAVARGGEERAFHACDSCAMRQLQG